MKNWWTKFIFEKIDIPFCDFFKRLKFKLKDATDFKIFFEENFQKLFEESNKLTKDLKRKEKLINFTEKLFSDSIKRKLLFDEDKQQSQKRLYHILIRDMNIINSLQGIWNPFLLEIIDVIFSNDYHQWKVIFDENVVFFNEMKIEIMEKIEDMMNTYKGECTKICSEFFENIEGD